MVHFFVEEDRSRVIADRWAERGALRGAERALVRLVAAHVGVAAIRRQSARGRMGVAEGRRSGSKSYKIPAAVAGSFCVRPAALTRSHRPDPRVDARHPRGSFALGGTDPSAAGRLGEGRSGVNPHTHTVRNPVPESLQHPEVLLVVRAPRICGAGGFLSLWQTVAEIVADVAKFVANESEYGNATGKSIRVKSTCWKDGNLGKSTIRRFRF